MIFYYLVCLFSILQRFFYTLWKILPANNFQMIVNNASRNPDASLQTTSHGTHPQENQPVKRTSTQKQKEIQWPLFLGTPGSETWKHCHGIPSSNAPGFVTRFARASALAHVPCSHTPPALLLQAVRWPQGKVPAPHPASGVTSSRRIR